MAGEVGVLPDTLTFFEVKEMAKAAYNKSTTQSIEQAAVLFSGKKYKPGSFNPYYEAPKISGWDSTIQALKSMGKESKRGGRNGFK
jgi:hypothetical protein